MEKSTKEIWKGTRRKEEGNIARKGKIVHEEGHLRSEKRQNNVIRRGTEK